MKKHLLAVFSLLIVTALAQSACAQHHAENHERIPATEGANVYIVTPQHGEVVPQKFKVVFGLQGMGICPAGVTGEGVPIPDTGHHHLLIDVDELPDMNKPLPMDQTDTIKHFGKGQTETVVELAPGKHTLQLVFADYAHVPFEPVIKSEKITVTVK